VPLAWLRPPVIPIFGARRVEQIKDNLASLELELTPDQITVLDEASAIELASRTTFTKGSGQ
jgi:aryl-alcohol dehydrogenase-like predicted oxidoreductase